MLASMLLHRETVADDTRRAGGKRCDNTGGGQTTAASNESGRRTTGRRCSLNKRKLNNMLHSVFALLHGNVIDTN